jgi:ankyrin repeat protein
MPQVISDMLGAICTVLSDPSLVRLLVERGADINAEHNDGKTVLYWANLEENVAVVQLLVDKGRTLRSRTSTKNGTLAVCLLTKSQFSLASLPAKEQC